MNAKGGVLAVMQREAVALGEERRTRDILYGERDLLEAHNDVSALVKAAEQAVASEGGLRYAHDEDEIGERACCLVTSYKPHAPDCWVPRLAAALNKVKGG